MITMKNYSMNNTGKSLTRRGAFTLVEVLVAVVLTLILLGLMIRAFSISGSEIAKGRALLEMGGQLRSTAELLRKDLAGVTAHGLAGNDFGSATGYFEYIEGIARDNTVHLTKTGANDSAGVYGDIDDILMFTSRSQGQPFRGRWRNQTIESNYAEIIWWTVLEDINGDGVFNIGDRLRLYRRVLLIRPDLDPDDTGITNIGEFLQLNDVSVSLGYSNEIRTNAIDDLTIRGNRFARNGTSFPNEPNYAIFQGSDAFVLSNQTALGTDNTSEGEDIMLKSLAAFDVKIFDPEVEIRQSNDGRASVVPSDSGYITANTTVIGNGGYVDLNAGQGNGQFTFPPNLPAPDDASILWTNATYCTWSTHYESDGLDNDNDGLSDEGINGVDNDNINGPDDIDEKETLAPYPYPLRGIQVTIRIVEPTNQIVRQTSVIANFVPE